MQEEGILKLILNADPESKKKKKAPPQKMEGVSEQERMEEYY